eukprot:8552963-Ditylum_brightwellii.AAC.1
MSKKRSKVEQLGEAGSFPTNHPPNLNTNNDGGTDSKARESGSVAANPPPNLNANNHGSTDSNAREAGRVAAE